jgi:hypothetical protein
LQESALLLGQDQVFEQSSKLLKRLCGVDLSGKQTENLCHHYGQKLEEQMESSIEERVIVEKTAALHYVMVDGSYVMSREKGWTETKVGRVFKAGDNFKVSEKREIIKESVYMAHIGTHEAFIDKFSCLLNPLTYFVFLADGGTWMWKWIADFYPNAIQILDFFHAYQKICQWATVVFKDDQLMKDWCENARLLLLDNGLDELLLDIQGWQCEGQVLEKKNALLTYLTNNATRMTYKTFLEKGYLIGSGAIESAQRTVVQQRLKRSGQRWTIKGGQQVLNLRIKNLSNQWKQVTDLVRIAA